jgi:DNA repair exonuclease SbcCD nuclease subunit
MRVKFAHLSDVHLGAWRNDNLNQVGYKVFTKAIETFIEEKVDFVVISGDLYDISNPKVDVVDLATKNFKKLADHGIPIYGIMGSHDFSPSDKSMIRGV